MISPESEYPETFAGDSRRSNGDIHIEVRDVNHFYGGERDRYHALEDINISISRGEVASIVGASGCGKSTLLRILAGLLKPTSGSVRLDNEEILGIPKEVGLIFQNYENTLLKWKSVYKNVALGAELRKKQHPEAADIDVRKEAKRYLEMVGLQSFETAKPQELSGGMKQRVQVARILAYNPDVLLCDEPFGALDAQTKEQLQEDFLEILHQNPATTVFVTHDIEEAIYLGDTVFTFTENEPGRVDAKEDIPFKRPRFPKTEFETGYYEDIVEKKKRILDRMQL